MPTNTQLSLFCLTASILILTPGPNFLYVLTRGITQGRRPALMAALGLGCGVMLHTTLAAIGVAALVRTTYLAFQIIKYSGSCYLIYLGVKTLTDHDRPPLIATPLGATRNRAIIGQSIAASMGNPKTILFFLSFLPQFLNAAAPSAAPQLLLLGGIYMLLTVLLYGMIGYFAGGIGRWLQRQPCVASRLRRLTGGCFIGLGAWAAIPDSR
jgi:threonine/homoserine/homoserine lactone efflux protein